MGERGVSTTDQISDSSHAADTQNRHDFSVPRTATNATTRSKAGQTR